jgi:hypothetical protein
LVQNKIKKTCAADNLLLKEVAPPLVYDENSYCKTKSTSIVHLRTQPDTKRYFYNNNLRVKKHYTYKANTLSICIHHVRDKAFVFKALILTIVVKQLNQFL